MQNKVMHTIAKANYFVGILRYKAECYAEVILYKLIVMPY